MPFSDGLIFHLHASSQPSFPPSVPSPKPGEEGPLSVPCHQGPLQHLELQLLILTVRAWTQLSIRKRMLPRSPLTVWYPPNPAVWRECLPIAGPPYPHPCRKRLFSAHKNCLLTLAYMSQLYPLFPCQKPAGSGKPPSLPGSFLSGPGLPSRPLLSGPPSVSSACLKCRVPLGGSKAPSQPEAGWKGGNLDSISVYDLKVADGPPWDLRHPLHGPRLLPAHASHDPSWKLIRLGMGTGQPWASRPSPAQPYLLSW